jgi:tetratricopeptide (TPR) repeat protein
MNEIRNVKKHKETLNIITHQLLHIRHQFKVGFFSELKRDIPSAVKSYKNAYSYLTESARIHDTTILEMKIIAGFLTYKICRISFELSQPVEAINHFRRHADIFKTKVGPNDLAFEHKAWLSKQFQTFGDLFTRCPLAIQTQHPGFYYQEAAYQSMARKQIAQTTCHRIEQANFDPSEFLKPTEFYGQRPWRQHHQSMEITDAQKEREAILALRDAESHVNHSELIISLLVQAITHFKKHSSNRMKLYLMYNLAEEYASSKDYDKALNYYNHIVQAYRTEQWWPILEAILPAALKCAYLSVKLQDWIQFSLEVLNPNINLPIQIKNQTQIDLENLIIKSILPQVDSIASSKNNQWKALLIKQSIIIDADPFKGLLECKVYFTHEAVSVDSEITLQVALKNGFPLPIQFNQLIVYFNLKEYDGLANITDSEKLKFSPGEQRILTFNFTPKNDHVQRTLEIASVSLIYGLINQIHIDFQWRTSFLPTLSFQQTSLTPKWRMKSEHVYWENLPVRRKTNVIMRVAEVKLSVQHQLPVLLYESYPIKIQIKNCENVDIHSSILTCICSNADENPQTLDDTFLSYSTTENNNETISQSCTTTFATIKQDAEIEQDLYVRCNNNRSREITIQLSYERLNLRCMKEIFIQLNVVNPFSIQFQTMGMMMEPLTSLRAQEPFILMIDTKCTSAIPITIVSSSFKPSQFIVSE